MSIDNQKTDGIDDASRITLIGAGTIGLSFAALHLQYLAAPDQLTIHDIRPDLKSYVQNNLPKYLPPHQHSLISHVRLSSSDDSFPNAVKSATIIQEQGPENAPFKISIWKQIEKYASKEVLLWSSTSGIPASVQSQEMKDKSRLLVVHPYNPPHIMPLFLQKSRVVSTREGFVLGDGTISRRGIMCGGLYGCTTRSLDLSFISWD